MNQRSYKPQSLVVVKEGEVENRRNQNSKDPIEPRLWLSRNPLPVRLESCVLVVSVGVRVHVMGLKGRKLILCYLDFSNSTQSLEYSPEHEAP
jgi:hypothetical protein